MAYKFGHKQDTNRDSGSNNVDEILANISKHLETDEEENATSHILNHLKYQFPTSTEPLKVSSDQNTYWFQNFNQQAMSDDLTSLVSSGFKYSDSSMNTGDSLYNSASRNTYNPQYLGESSIYNVDMELVTSRENESISRSSAENFYQQSSFANQGQYRSFIGEKQIAYNSSFPTSMNFQYSNEATQTQISNCGTYLQPQAKISDPQHLSQWTHQLPVKDQLNGFKIPRLNTWEPVQGPPRVSEERSNHNCYGLNGNLCGSSTFCMESRKRRKYDLFETLNNKCGIDSGTLMDLVNSKPSPVKLPPLEDVSEEKEKPLTTIPGPQLNNTITDVATEINEITEHATNGEIKLPSSSLADSFTASQIKQHLSSFIQPNKNITPSDSQNQCQLCSMDKLLLAPAPIYCSSCDLRIKYNVGYYQLDSGESTTTKHSVCVSCYKRQCDSILLIRGGSILKGDLQKAKNDEEREDSWVQCDRCQHWQHRICGLYNAEKDEEGKAEYICPKCRLIEMENGDRLWLPHTVLGAKDLPRTNLSNHIEQRLFTRMKQERVETAKFLGVELDKVLEAEGLVVRVVVSVDKQLEVKQQFRDIFHGEYYPEKVSYRSKLILLFQRTGGVDLCIFGIYVQEYGSNCEGPNKRCVYISYLDSVKYFQPERKTASDESLRTFVYHEILIGYLEDCKKRGFATCYIWSCPLKKGEDYIFYCHPDTQKTPQKDKLRQWYKLMLHKAIEEGIVVDQTNLYNQFFVPSKEGNILMSTARLPYFDGDCWSVTAECISKVLDEEERSRKLCNKLPKRLEETAPKDELVMQKLGEKIRTEKENFMIVRLQHMCTSCHELILSGSRWSCNQCNKIHLCSRCFHHGKLLSSSKKHTCRSGKKEPLAEVVVNDVPLDTKDKDDVLEYNVFETRDDLMTKCEKSIYQFDTLCNAKYSSMMILYHFTRNLVVQPKADTCHTHNSTHPFAEVTPAPKSKEPHKQNRLTLNGALDALVHSSRCKKSMDCSNPDCRIIRKLMDHSSKCVVRVRNGCENCKQAWWIIKEHTRNCTDSNCRIYSCMNIRKKRARAASSFENNQNLMQ